jgi:hypothetical protein
MKYNFESLYEHIGYLFYGMVSRNGKLSASDLLKLTELIDSLWKPDIAGDARLSDHLADCIHRGVRFASVNLMSSPHSIESFKNYLATHSLAFSALLRERISTSVDQINQQFKKDGEMSVISFDDLSNAVTEVGR